VRCTSDEELFPLICKDAVEFGGLKMAWIGMIDEASHSVRPVASFGAGIEYLEGLEISMDANKATGRGPTGISIREAEPYWCQDFQNDPATAAWHERGAMFDWGASASLPLHRKGAVIGAFTLYAGEVNAFDEPAQNLLVEMAMDISFALDHYASEAERVRTELALQQSEQYLRTIIETEPECVKVVDREGQLLEMNPAGLAMLEADSLEQARERGVGNFCLPEYRDALDAMHQRVMQGEDATLEFEIEGLKGTRRWLETHETPLRDAEGNVSHLLGITLDITERKENEERIKFLANFDALTGLPNRRQLDDHLKFALSLAKRSHEQLALMFIDLDRFKDVNDTLGHSIGDAYLVEMANRLQQVLREEDSVSRLGGDEFILMLPNSDTQGAAQVAQKILDIISVPCRVEQYDLTMTASIGIAMFPDDGADLETLSKSADTAMYRAKQEGRDGYCFFTAAMQASATRNMHLVIALRQALELGQMQVHYQPQISITDGRVIGVEALLRWQHPELGPVSPAEFIPVAEDSGLILSIGEWVLRTAVRQLKHWIDRGCAPMVVAVNLSAIQFRHPSLSKMVTRILEEEELSPEYLELELTEGVAMYDPQAAVEIMDNLHELGIRMSIDDFGTGYSSLNYLKKFKVYKLKIDQSFVRDITTDQEDRAIVAAIISMSRDLGLQTIAEGVETVEQLDYLRAQGCNEAQGYYFNKPMPAAEIESLFYWSQNIQQ
jgi:diguanylate cyclase (GGDEF)-like protein/PAS domain S-box-containing protein